MNLYTSLTLRYLKENKKRTIVTIIGIILSTALICGIGNIYSSFMDYQLRETIQNDGSFHATFNDVTKDKIDYITKSAGISNSGINKEFGYANTGEGNLLKVSGYDKNYFKGFNISLKEGNLPKNKNEIVISENSNLIDGKYKIGDSITLSVGKRLSEDGEYLDSPTVQFNDKSQITEKLVNTKEETFKIVGIMNRPGFEFSNGIPNAITYIDKSLVNNNDKVNVSITVNNPKDVYSIASSICKNAKLEQKTYDDGIKGDNVNYNEHLLRLQGASAYANINDSIGYIVLLVGSLVIVCTIATVYNSFSISIAERKKQFGILNSIGTTNSQIMKLVFLEGFIVSIIAIPIGLLSGTVAMDIVFKIIQKFYANSFIADMNLRVVYNPVVIIFSIVVVLITIFISVIIPARVASKVSPLDAIKNISDYKVGKVKDSKLVRFIFKTEGVLAYKNLRRNKKKFRITLFSLIISVVIFIAFSGFMTLFLKAESVRSGEMNYDISIYGTRANSDKKTKKLVSELSKIDGVKKISFSNTNSLSMDLEEEKINKNAKEKVQSYFEPEKENNKTVYKLVNNELDLPGDIAVQNIKLTEGSFDKDRAIKENGVILINKSYYEEKGKKGVLDMTNYKVGDTIELYSMGYDEKTEKEYKEKTYKFKIMGISEEILTGKYTYPYMGIGLVTYDEVAKNNGFNTLSNNIYIESDQKESTRESISNLANKYKFNVYDQIEEYQEMQDSMKVMQIFVYGFVTVISLVSVTNIVNTISTNINLRKKELAIIKSIGVTPSGFNKMIYLESFLYGVLALAWGIPIGILLTILMNTILGDVISFGLVLPYSAIFICIIAIFIITFIASYIPMRKINKENIIDNIRQDSI